MTYCDTDSYNVIDMNDSVFGSFANYSPVGDILTLAICLSFLILIKTAFVSKTRNFRLFRFSICTLFAATACDVLYHVLMQNEQLSSFVPVYAARTLYHTFLFATMYIYVLYAKETMSIGGRTGQFLVSSGGQRLRQYLYTRFLGQLSGSGIMSMRRIRFTPAEISFP